MKKLVLFLSMLYIFAPRADACVLKMLTVGVLNSTEGQVMSEVLAVLINERTGTNVNTRFYKNTQELYEALKVKQVDIIIENTDTARQLLNRQADAGLSETFEAIKLAYEKEMGLIWLRPFGFLHGSGGRAQSNTAPVIKAEVLNNFPGLPRVLDKLAGVITDEAYARLIKSVESGDKPKKAARDFLKTKRLI